MAKSKKEKIQKNLNKMNSYTNYSASSPSNKINVRYQPDVNFFQSNADPERIEFAHDNSLNFPNTGFTISFNYLYEDGPSFRTVISKFEPTGTPLNGFLAGFSGGKIVFYLYSGQFSGISASVQTHGVWHNCTIVVPSRDAKTWKIYIDGKLDLITIDSNSLETNDVIAWTGDNTGPVVAHNSYNNLEYIGKSGNHRMWNRVLTSTEIQAIGNIRNNKKVSLQESTGLDLTTDLTYDLDFDSICSATGVIENVSNTEATFEGGADCTNIISY